MSITFLGAMAASAIQVAGLAIDRQNKLLTSDNMEDSIYLAAGVFPAGVAWTTGSSPLSCDTHFLICGVLTRLSWAVPPQTTGSHGLLGLSWLSRTWTTHHPNAWQEVEEPLLEHVLGRQHHVLGQQTPAGSSSSCAGSDTPAGSSTISGSSFAAESCPPADSPPAETTRHPSLSRELESRFPAEQSTCWAWVGRTRHTVKTTRPVKPSRAIRSTAPIEDRSRGSAILFC